jgi:hypothetical protein
MANKETSPKDRESDCRGWEICREHRCAALIIAVVWAVILLAASLTGKFIWLQKLPGGMDGLVIVAVFFGAWGGWSKSIIEIWRFMYKTQNQDQQLDEEWKPNPWNNLVLKPLCWPFCGAVFGLALTLIFYDVSTPPLRAVLTGIAGGASWDAVLNHLGGLSGVGKKKSKGT